MLRIILFFIVFTLSTFTSMVVKASCDVATGNFYSCGHADNQSPIIIEYGTNPATVKPIPGEDEVLPGGDLPYIPVPISYTAPKGQITILGNSNIYAHAISFTEDTTITVSDASSFSFTLYNNTSNLTINIDDNFNGANTEYGVAYLGGEEQLGGDNNTGEINVNFINSVGGADSGYFRTLGDLNIVDFSSEIGNLAGRLYVGEAGGAYDPTEIHVNEILGGAWVVIEGNTTLVVNEKEGGVATFSLIEGQMDGATLILNQEAEVYGINNLQNLTINKATTIGYATGNTASGTYIINATTDIEEVGDLNNLEVNATLTIQDISSLNNVTIAADNTLFLTGGNGVVDNNLTGISDDFLTPSINNLHGEGTLIIDPENQLIAYTLSYADIKKIELNGGTLVIDTQDPALTEDTDAVTGETIYFGREIDTITTTDTSSAEAGGNFTVRGEMTVNNLDYVNTLKLEECDGTNCTIDGALTELTLNNTNHIENFQMYGGTLYVNVTDDKDGLNTVNNDIQGGEIQALILDTSVIHEKKETFTVITSENVININSETPEGVELDLTTNLPEWYDYQYLLSEDDKTLTVDVWRVSNYNNAVNDPDSTYGINNPNSMGDVNSTAGYLDNIVDSGLPMDHTSNVLSYLDQMSADTEELAQNISTLKPIDNNVFARNIHSNTKDILEVVDKQAMRNSTSHLIRDYRKAPIVEDNKFWVEVATASGSNDAQGNIASDDFTFNLLEVGYTSNGLSESGLEFFKNNVFFGVGGGDIQSGMYTVNSNSFNVGDRLDYRFEDYIFSISGVYTSNSYDNTREYFASTYTGDIHTKINSSAMMSNSRMNEIAIDLQLGKEYFLEYFRTLHNWEGLVVKPKVFSTTSVITSRSYEENKGEASMAVDNYRVPVIEAGVGMDVYKKFASNNNNYTVYSNFNSFYRYYNAPDTVAGFTEMPRDLDVVYLGDKNAYFVGLLELGMMYNLDNYSINIHYSAEVSKHYSENKVSGGLSYSF